MPLKSGSSNKTKSANIKEVMDSYKRSGKIGNSRPATRKNALKQAIAVAYSKARRSSGKKSKRKKS